MRPSSFPRDEQSQPENTRPERSPWFEDEDEPLTHPDPERLRTSTAALKITLDHLERTLAS